MSIHMNNAKKIKLFTGNANPYLARSIANRMNLPMGEAVVSEFSDGEIRIQIMETVRGASVYLMQTLSDPINKNIMELLIMIDALKRASADSITAVVPYFAYSRQDRKANPRDPISAKLLANLLQAAGADRVLTMDLHAPQIQGFFDIPVDHIYGMPLLTDYFAKLYNNNMSNVVAVSPDIGRVNSCRVFAEHLGIPIAIVDKRRTQPGVSEVMDIIGDVKGKDVIIADDIIDTGGTICNAATALAERGAKRIYACATHPILSGPGVQRLNDSVIHEVVLLDTIVIPEHKRIPKIKQLSVAGVFAEVIERIHDDLSVSSLFSSAAD